MNTENPKVECKSTQLISILSEHLAGKINLARIKFFALFICAMCKVETVCFEKLSTAFESQAKPGSSLRRIQRFFAGYKLASDLIALIIFKILPHKPPYRLAMDRTCLAVRRNRHQCAYPRYRVQRRCYSHPDANA